MQSIIRDPRISDLRPVTTRTRTVSVCTTAESVRCGGVCHLVRRRGHTVQGGAGAVESSVSDVCRCRTYLDLSALATCCDEVPRRTTHEEIAADLDIAPATVGKQLRKIESRVLTRVAGGVDTT